MATIVDVARKASVSKSTVSRVLNGLPVKEETRIMVVSAIKELDYRPNAQARGLTSGKTHVVGIVTPEMNSPFYSPILDGCHRALWASGFSMMVCSTYNRQGNEWELSRMLWEKRVDGILILTPRSIKDKPMQKLLRDAAEKGFPIVVADGESDHPNVSCVCVDNEEGGYIATKHLLELGHRSIGIVLGIPDTFETMHRLQGYRRALQEWGVPFTADLVFDAGEYSYEAGKAIAPDVLRRDCSALFVTSDDIAVGLMDVFHAEGIQIPRDKSVIGYDDLLHALIVTPKLTTIRQPLVELGQIAARKLAKVITKEERNATRITLKTDLVVRQSTANFLTSLSPRLKTAF